MGRTRRQRTGAVLSAEILREAATLMRDRAKDAVEAGSGEGWAAAPHWRGPDNHGWIVHMDPEHDGFDPLIAELGYDYEGHTSRHIASWHPVVALAVADWLEGLYARCTDFSEYDEDEELTKALSTGEDIDDWPEVANALAVARAYLG